MRETYLKPSMSVVQLRPTSLIMASVNSVNSNSVGITYGGGSNSWARAGQRNDFEGEEEDF